jgi:DnaJ like chaperone protein
LCNEISEYFHTLNNTGLRTLEHRYLKAMAGTGWTGKGTGALLGGIVGAVLIPKIGLLLGAVIGALWGHQYDQSQSAAGKRFSGFSRISSAERQQVFFESVFLAMGRLAKVDGRVSEEEIQVARSFMHRWGLGP